MMSKSKMSFLLNKKNEGNLLHPQHFIILSTKSHLCSVLQ